LDKITLDFLEALFTERYHDPTDVPNRKEPPVVDPREKWQPSPDDSCFFTEEGEFKLEAYLDNFGLTLEELPPVERKVLDDLRAGPTTPIRLPLPSSLNTEELDEETLKTRRAAVGLDHSYSSRLTRAQMQFPPPRYESAAAIAFLNSL
jgi:hypothetical protein